MKKLIGIFIVVATLVYSINNQAQAGGRGGLGLVGRILGGGGYGFNQGFRQGFRQSFGYGHGFGYRQNFSQFLGGGCGGVGLGFSQSYCAPAFTASYCAPAFTASYCAPPIVYGGGTNYFSAGYAAPIGYSAGYSAGYAAPASYVAPPPAYTAPPAQAPAQTYIDFTAFDERYVTKREFADFADDVYRKIDRLRQNQREENSDDTDY